jgi:hypothetical protein
LFGVVAAVALASGAMFALVGPASAQTQGNSFTVIKVVSGSVPSGTVFAVQVSCTGNGSTNLWFDDTGHPSTSSGTQIATPVITPSASDTCTASETFSGGASSISYACSASGTLTTCSGNNAVHYGDTSTGVGAVTITNTFSSTTTTTTTTIAPAVTTLPPVTTTTLAPKPAPVPVVAPAHFTG